MGYCTWAGMNDGIINDHDEICDCYKLINEKYPTVNKRRDKEVY